jgi:hypothetical protein
MTSRIDIEALVADLKPVQRIKPELGLAVTMIASVFASFAIINTYGLRPDILEGMPHPLVTIRSGLLLLLGMATAISVTAAALPSVGRTGDGWLWALAAALLLPVSALVAWLYHSAANLPFAPGDVDFRYAKWCLQLSIGSALLIGGALTVWLRTGAPISLNRAGWLVGIAGGSFGTFSYSLHCPSNSIFYVGLFYTMAVAASACIGRLIVPRLIRW